MANRETGKQRRSRIPLDYYKRRDPLARTKKWLGVTAALVAFGYWATGWLNGGDIGRMRYSRGGVASVHATWDANCVACHEPATPVDRKSWLFGSPFARLVGDATSMDTKCKSCHSGVAHSQYEKAAETESCAHCHREHRGRDASLARVPDRECTVCHADLSSHRESSGTLTGDSVKVSGFTADQHPKQFTSLPAEDPGGLLFSHKRHMARGLVEAGADELTAEYFTSKLADSRDQAEFARRYGRGKSDAPIQLDCFSCHQLDPGDFPIDPDESTTDVARRVQAGAQHARPSGEYMMPITYENQCRLCHPLRYDAAEPAMAHGLQPAEMRAVLEGVFVKKLIGDSKLFDEPVKKSRSPGRRDDETETVRQAIADKLDIAESQLYRSQQLCFECHSFEGKLDEETETPRSVVSTAVPNVWLRNSRFDHAAHRGVKCEDCHGDVTTSTESHDEPKHQPLFLKMDVCQQCHAPPSGGRAPVGGARHDCVECHRYHNGDEPLHGVGAVARDGTNDRTIKDFLAGSISREPAKAPAKK